MSLPRMTVKRWMAVVAVSALVVWATRVIPETLRRWVYCLDKAQMHARAAEIWDKWSPKVAESHDTVYRTEQQGLRDRLVAYHRRQSHKYHRATYIPWEF